MPRTRRRLKGEARSSVDYASSDAAPNLPHAPTEPAHLHSKQGNLNLRQRASRTRQAARRPLQRNKNRIRKRSKPPLGPAAATKEVPMLLLSVLLSHSELPVTWPVIHSPPSCAVKCLWGRVGRAARGALVIYTALLRNCAPFRFSVVRTVFVRCPYGVRALFARCSRVVRALFVYPEHRTRTTERARLNTHGVNLKFRGTS